MLLQVVKLFIYEFIESEYNIIKMVTTTLTPFRNNLFSKSPFSETHQKVMIIPPICIPKVSKGATKHLKIGSLNKHSVPKYRSG